MKYFSHITVNTGHTRCSYRNEVVDDVVQTMKEWLEQMKNVEHVNIYDNYYYEILHVKNAIADFSVTIVINGWNITFSGLLSH